ncbi:MAG: hypothetical protein FVQ77_08885 [Cytophagales bacterium]|nr:hypothetical protein [Cytophagales bacterium]
MKITFVNHASFIMEKANVRVICDPWFEGPVFNNGWKLLVDTKFKYEDYSKITHIWFSHEHPDHFFPPNLKKIPKEIRENITVLFQYTKDKRVVGFCNLLGFKEVIELKKNAWFTISNDFKILCERFTEGDSWACFKTNDITILNTNDCWISNLSDAKRIKSKVDHVDILFNQFSYAFWAGNKDQPELREKIAKEKLDAYKLECDVFKPTYTIPFASFVWFAHKENYYINDKITTIDRAHKFLKDNTDVEPVILYPGEEYTVNDDHDSLKSLEKYAKDYSSVFENPLLLSSPKIDIKEVKVVFDEYRNECIKNNDLLINFFLKQLKPATIHLCDYDQTYELSFKSGLIKVQRHYENCDISLSSDSLLFCLKFPFGMDTLGVNGRYQRPQKGKYTRFYNLFRIEQLRSRGRNVNLFYLIGVIFRKLKVRAA